MNIFHWQGGTLPEFPRLRDPRKRGCFSHCGREGGPHWDQMDSHGERVPLFPPMFSSTPMNKVGQPLAAQVCLREDRTPGGGGGQNFLPVSPHLISKFPNCGFAQRRWWSPDQQAVCSGWTGQAAGISCPPCCSLRESVLFSSLPLSLPKARLLILLQICYTRTLATFLSSSLDEEPSNPAVRCVSSEGGASAASEHKFIHSFIPSSRWGLAVHGRMR